MHLSTSMNSPIPSSSFGPITILRIGTEKKEGFILKKLNEEKDLIAV